MTHMQPKQNSHGYKVFLLLPFIVLLAFPLPSLLFATLPPPSLTTSFLISIQNFTPRHKLAEI